MQYVIIIVSENVYFAGFDGDELSFAESLKGAKKYNCLKAIKKDIKTLKKMMTVKYDFTHLKINN